jgi:hypothetical protein
VDVPTPRDDDPGPSLLRATDRARQALRRAQLVLGALAIGVAVLVGAAASGHEVTTAPPGTTLAEAELLEPSPLPEAAMLNPTLATRARWTTSGGLLRTGSLRVDAGLPEGAMITVAVDAAGEVVDARTRIADSRVTGLTAGLSTLLACWAVLALCAVLCRARLDALDARQWADDWARVEPEWTGRAG